MPTQNFEGKLSVKQKLFFYIFTTVILMVTALGRTPLIGPLKPFLQKTFSLSAVSISAMYTLGTLIASLCISGFGGYIYRRYLVGKLFLLAFLIFAIVPVGLCVLTLKHNLFTGMVIFVFLVCLFFLMRFVAQGLIPLFLRNMTALYCKPKEQPWVSALHTTALTLSVGGLTWLIASVQNKFEWPTIWGFQTIILLLCGVLSWWFFKNEGRILNPQSIKSVSLKDWARLFSFNPNKIFFLLGMMLLGLHQLQATGISFHMADFARESNLDFKKAFSLFWYISLIGIGVNFFCSWLSNRCPLIMLFVFLSVCLLGTAICLKFLNNIYGASGFVFFSAGSWSFNHILAYIMSPRLISKQELPNGNALIVGACTFCSAVGPLILSLFQECLGTFFLGNCIVSVFSVFCVLGMFLVVRFVKIQS